MKKEYINPSILMIDIDMEQILASSGDSDMFTLDVSNPIQSNAEDAAAKENNSSFWELEE